MTTIFSSRWALVALNVLLLSACQKEQDTPQPAPRASLEGKWMKTADSYRYSDAQGKTTASGSSPTAPSSIYLEIGPETWRYTGNISLPMVYVRTNDSTAATFTVDGPRLTKYADYTLPRVTDHLLITRTVLPQNDGGHFVRKEYFSR